MDRHYRFKVASPDDARDWVASIEANSTLVEVERLPPPNTPRKRVSFSNAPAPSAAAPRAKKRLPPALVGLALVAAALVWRLFGLVALASAAAVAAAARGLSGGSPKAAAPAPAQ